jgi:glycosyltransferase involved in cell wall biosynthesis
VSRLERKIAKVRGLVRHEGVGGVAARGLRRLADRVAPPSQTLSVARADVLAAAEVQAAGGPAPAPLPVLPGEPLTVAVVIGPPDGGSGGHTTTFRLMGALEQAGHRCILYFYDRWGDSLAHHEEILREWWPWVRAEVRDAAGGIEDAHAVMATAWPTAYAVLASPAKGTRFYLVQDLEPRFYPAGGEALLAEATYGFGFHGITAGPWLAERLRADYGMAADHFDFGCDVGRYGLTGAEADRTGVCFFARQITPRRAFDLGVLALEVFHQRHPDVPIHIYGDKVGRMPFPATDHGVLTPDELNTLYNRCVAGLTLSATNVSLVPHEMLASGCIPVVNDAEHNRMVLANDHVAYAPPTPTDLADALARLVGQPAGDIAAGARAASVSVADRSWDEAGAVVERTISRVVREAADAGS